MKKRCFSQLQSSLLIICLLSIVLGSCKKIAGLPLQENTAYNQFTINPNYNGTAWQFIKDRGLSGDTLFSLMYKAIIYSGIDTNEYTKPNRTYFVYNNDAIDPPNTATKPSSCYFGKYKVGGKSANSWADYPKEQIKNHLLSLILPKFCSYDNLNNVPQFTTTLMPLNTDTLNPFSLMTLHLTNDRNSLMMINAFPYSIYLSTTAPGLSVKTGGIIATNGAIHVVGKVVFFQQQQTAWDLIKDRGIRGDSIFNLMYQGILYSGIDTNEYARIGRTYILYTNNAINRMVNGAVTDDCYFGKYKVGGQPATSWSQYPKEQVKNHLLSLMVLGTYTATADTARQYANTLMPLNYDTLNPNSQIVFYSKTKSSLRINDFSGSQVPKPNLSTPGFGLRNIGISGIGSIYHAIERVVFYQKK